MSIVAKIGFRTYEFETHADLTQARSIYAHCLGDQNEFETELEECGISFTYDFFEQNRD